MEKWNTTRKGYHVMQDLEVFNACLLNYVDTTGYQIHKDQGINTYYAQR